jgi:autotransporter-associated beta strand protein
MLLVRPTFRSTLVFAFVTACLGCGVAPAVAQTTLYWDGDGAGAANGGSGTWNTTLARFTTSDTGTTYQAWVNGTAIARFENTGAYTVTLGANITAGQAIDEGFASMNLNGFTLTLGGDNSDSSSTFYFSGGGNLIKTGTGTLTLNGLNDHTGFTEIQSGTLIASSASSLGRGTLIFSGGAVQMTGDHSLGTKDISVTTSGTLDTNGFNATHSGVISGSGSFTKNGAGTLTLSGANTLDGGLILNAGTLQLGNSGTVLADALAVTVNGGEFRVGAANETIGSLAGTGGIVDLRNVAGRTLTVGGNDSSTTYAGVIQGTGGALVKTGRAHSRSRAPTRTRARPRSRAARCRSARATRADPSRAPASSTTRALRSTDPTRSCTPV